MGTLDWDDPFFKTPPAFNEHQRIRLRKLGCTPDQFECLLAAAADWRELNRRQFKGSIRKPLDRVRDHARRLKTALDGLLREGAPREIQAACTLLRDSLDDDASDGARRLTYMAYAARALEVAADEALTRLPPMPRGIRTKVLIFSLLEGCLRPEQFADRATFKAVVEIVYLAALGVLPEASRWRGMLAAWAKVQR